MTNEADIPLCVDLDGTLIAVDTLHENLVGLCTADLRHAISLPSWLMQGRSSFKHQVAEVVTFDAALLPYRVSVLAMIKEAKAAGRQVILTTAAPSRVATLVADHLGVFDDVISSEAGINLSGVRKADALQKRYGYRGFDYVGDSKADLPVFAKARRAFLVGSRESVRKLARKQNPETTFLPPAPASPRTWARTLRVHQWLKNGLVFLPLAAAHRFTELPAVLNSLLAFIAFCLCASSVYILNDLNDLQTDRAHRTKKARPLASGQLPVAVGVVVAPLLLITAIFIAVITSYALLAVLLGYFVLTCLYSFWLKRQVVVDIIILTILYTSRIVAGGAATGIPLSFWILVFSMFIFLSLALVKRYSELRLAAESGKLIGRGYHTTDLPVLLSLGSSSGLASVLVLSLYIESEGISNRYAASEWLWIPPLLTLYWVTRLWIKVHRGEVNEDPVLFAASDWQSLTIAALTVASFVLAAVGSTF